MPFLGNTTTSFNVDGNNINNGAITSEKIAAGAVVNADVNDTASIAGTKISADFGAQNLIVDTNLFFVDATNDRVGIGTTSPDGYAGTLLQIHDSSTRSSIRLTNSNSGATKNDGFEIEHRDGYVQFNYRESGYLEFLTANSPAMRIDSSGRLLIGTDSATTGTNSQYSHLQIATGSDGRQNGAITLFRDETSANISLNELLGEIYFGDNQAGEYARIKAACDGTAGVGDYPGRIEFHTTADSASSTTERMRIDSSGRVGIGTNDPGSFSSGGGEQLVVSNSGDCGITINAGTSSLSRLLFADGTGAASYRGFVSYEHSSDSLRIGTSSTDRVRIDSSGRVGVGTSSPGSYFSSGDNLVIYDSGDAGITIVGGTSSYSSIYFADGTSGSEAYSGYVSYNHTNDKLFLGTSGSSRVTIDSSGNVGIGITSPQDRLHVYNGGVYIESSSASGNVWTWYKNADRTWLTGNRGTNSDSYTIYDLTADAARLTINSSGNVGIGTTSPGQLLHIAGASAEALIAASSGTGRLKITRGATIVETYATTTYGVVGTASNSNLYLTVNGSTRATIDTSGRLLVGTSSARSGWNNSTIGGNIFQVERSGNQNSGGISVCTNGGTTSADLTASFLNLGKSRGTADGSNTVVASGDCLGRVSYQGADGSEQVEAAKIEAYVDGTPGANDMPGRLVFSTTADGASAPTERMRLTSNGYMRLGDSSYYHTIRGAGGNESLEFTANAGQQSAFAAGITKFFNSNAGGAITERMRIDRDGTVYINRTTTMASAGQLVVQGKDAAGGYAIVCSKAQDNNITYLMRFVYNNTTGTGSITTTSTTVTYATSSDYRLKENVVPLTGAADRLNQLQVHRFNFIADPDKTVDGFLAHEAQAVVPECVTGTHNEVEVWKEGEELPDGVSVGDNKLDEDGNTIPVYQGIDQAKLVPLLTAALQEALAEIESLKARVTALEP